MYDHFFGIIISKQPALLILRVNGVGYSINISFFTYESLPEVGAECLIYTYLQVKEDGHHLFGFLNTNEREFFYKITSVNGIGPLTGIRIMSGGKVEDLIGVIQRGNTVALSKIKGIGKKTAERIVLELGNTIGNIKIDSVARTNGNQQQKDAIAALITLGYNEKDAYSVVEEIVKNSPSASLDVIIREALKVI